MFVFASDLQDARLSEPGGDIKAIWLTYSDLLQMAFAHTHTQYTGITTELTERAQRTERNADFFLQASQKKGKKKNGSNCASATMASLWNTTLILTLNTF